MAAYALVGLGDVAVKTADFNEAHKDYEEALALRNHLGERDSIASTRVAIGELAIEEGHPSEAESLASDAREEFHRAKEHDDEIAAISVLARALLAEGKAVDAWQQLNNAALLVKTIENLAVRLEYAVVNGRVEFVSGKPGPARTTLKEALAMAKKAGFINYELESRLALEEGETAPRSVAESRVRLQKLERDAKEKNFDLIARKAAAAAKNRMGTAASPTKTSSPSGKAPTPTSLS